MNFKFSIQLDFKKKLLMQILLFFIVNLLIIYLVIIPTKDKILELKNLVLILRLENIERSESQKKSTAINDKLEKAEVMLGEFNKIFISQNREIEFITKLEQVANSHSINQKITLSNSAPIKEIGYTKTTLEINSQGSYDDVYKYLCELENLSYYYSVNFFELSNLSGSVQKNSDGSETEPVINIKLIGYTYWK